MKRRERFFALDSRLKKNNINVIMVQIEEAHTDLWPIGQDYLPKNHKDFDDRIERANSFIKEYDCPYPVYVDGWDNRFERVFRAWPDKYYFIDENKIVLNKSEYGINENDDGKVLLDYTNLLKLYL
jgi:hypothetical protein